LCVRCSRATYGTDGRSPVMRGSQVPLMRVDRREKGLAKAGNARVRRGVVQLAWRFLIHQKNSTLAQWYQACVAAGKKRKTMIVALARKLLIALWRFVATGDVPQGVVLRPAT
jgi:transposase